MAGMVNGESCTYMIKSSKGSPCFKIAKDSTITDAKVNITYIEFESAKTKQGAATGKSKTDAPETGMPARDQTYENSGDQSKAVKGGQ